MRRLKIIILILSNLLFSCSKFKGKERQTVHITGSPTMIVTDKFSNVLYTETKGPEKIEEGILDKKLQIIILQSYLDTYTTVDDDSNQITKYKDVQFTLTIKQNSKILLDTIIRKEQFKKHVTNEFYEEFINKSTLQFYSFLGLENNKLEFKGKISPELSSFGFEFLQSFDLKDRKLKFSIYNEVEE